MVLTFPYSNQDFQEPPRMCYSCWQSWGVVAAESRLKTIEMKEENRVIELGKTLFIVP
ncbi:MAG: hypothetical protein ACJA1C_001760 [Crocinitomicaceae bacterium]|jgi:hypothetical protein